MGINDEEQGVNPGGVRFSTIGFQRPNNDTNLVSYYSTESSANTSLVDDFGTTDLTTLNGSPSYNGSGFYNGNITYGAGDYHTEADVAAFNNADLTALFLVRYESASTGFNTLIEHSSLSSAGGGYSTEGWYVDDGGSTDFRIQVRENDNSSSALTFTASTGTLYWVALAYEDATTTADAYVWTHSDGVLQNSGTTSQGLGLADTHDFYVATGHNGGTNITVDEIYIYSDYKSQSTLQTIVDNYAGQA